MTVPAPAIVQPIVLAAGLSSRMGGNKLVAMLDGRPIIAHVVDALAEAGLPPPIVVLGHEPDAVRDALRGRALRYIEAPDYRQGLSRSLRAGIKAVPAAAKAALICLGDMPRIPPDLLRRICAEAGAASIVVPRLAGKPGNPVLWGHDHFARLAALEGDVGGRALMRESAGAIRFVDCDCPGIREDVDTVEDLLALQGEKRH